MSQADQQSPLERAVEAFDSILHDRGWGEPPGLLRTRHGVDPEAGAELAVRALSEHPAGALLGFVAPREWSAIGVSAEGWARHYEGDLIGYRATVRAGEEKRRIRSVTLLARDGTLAGSLRGQDGDVLREAPTDGLVGDCLRRAMGVVTSPPTASTDRLFASLWLEDVVASARRGCRAVTWHQAASRHPAVRMLGAHGPAPGRDGLVATARALGRVCDWALVRDQAIGGWKVGVDPHLAAWMDTGMLSRWLLDQRPPLEDLLARVRRRCTPAAMDRIAEALNELGVTATPSQLDPDPAADRRPGAA